MKKFICVFCIIFVFFSNLVSAKTLNDAIKMMMETQKIEVKDSTIYADRLQNRNEISEKSLISSAIENRVVIAKNNVLNVNGSDFSPVTDAVVRRVVSDIRYGVVSGNLSTLEKANHVHFSDETIYLTPNFSRKDLNSETLYTCVINADNGAEYVWVAGEFRQPSIYRARLYWADENAMVVTKLERKAFRFWMMENTSSYTEFDTNNLKIDRQFILDNLDQTVYIFADYRDGKYIAYGIGKE